MENNRAVSRLSWAITLSAMAIAAAAAVYAAILS
jgi:hypothetical protein